MANASPLSVFYGADEIYDEQGIIGFWTSFSSAGLRTISYIMIELGAYDFLKSLYSTIFGLGVDYQMTQLDLIVVAAVVGGIAGYLTKPFDNIKIKLMGGLCSNFIDCVSENIESNGVTSFFLGGVARVCEP